MALFRETNPKSVILYIVLLWTLLTCVGAKRRRLPVNHTPLEENGGKHSTRGEKEVKADGHHEYENMQMSEESMGDLRDDVTENDVAKADGNRSAHNSSKRASLNPDVFKQRMRAREIRLFHIQQQILLGLGFKEQPNFTALPELPHSRIIQDFANFHWVEEEEEEEKVIHHAGDDYLAKSVQALGPSCKIPPKTDSQWKSEDRFRLYFDMKAKDIEESDRVSFSSSTLWLYKKPLKDYESQDEVVDKNKKRSRSQNRKRKRHQPVDEEDRKIKVTVYRYLRPMKNDKKEKKELVSSQVVAKEFAGWVKLDMKTAVENWLHKPKRNFGILVVIEDSEGHVIKHSQVFVTPNCSTDNTFATLPLTLPLMRQSLHGNSSQVMARYNSSILPALDIYTVVKPPPGGSRLRRESHHNRQYSFKKPNCGTEEMYIKFEDLGWRDWIIQPQGFKHVTCKGSCSKFPRNKYFRRKVAKSEKNNFKPLDHECCGPVKFKPLKVIHLDVNRDIKLSIFEDFLITQCACLDGGN